jgi:hypothetical protein
MLFPRIPSRPVRYALIATHAFRDAISDVEVDFTKAERAIADKLDAVQAKLDEVMEKLAAYEEANNEGTEEITEQKPKAKRRATTGKRGAKAKK